MEDVRLIHADCLEVLPTLADSSVDLIVTDPPYFKVKDNAWDRQWDDPAAFLRWLGTVRDEWHRVLKPNGSLYCFASTVMAARVELLITERFNVLNSIRWQKDAGWAKRQCKEEQRAFFPASETIIFAEHYGADNVAKGEAGYEAKCDELRGFVFEPLRAWFLDAWQHSGLTRGVVDEACGTANVSQYWFLERNYQIPTAEKYAVLQCLAPRAFRRDYEDLRRDYEDLRRDYEDLRRDYEDLRRPFLVNADVPYTDVWTFPTVPVDVCKHPCEKPATMIAHIVATSSREGAMILDCFAGSGVVGEVCQRLNRRCILIEQDSTYVERIRNRLNDIPLFSTHQIGIERIADRTSAARKRLAREEAMYPLFPVLLDPQPSE